MGGVAEAQEPVSLPAPPEPSPSPSGPSVGWEPASGNWLLRLGVAFAFLYAAVSSLLRPTEFVEFFPSFLPASWATELLPCFAVYELVLVLGLVTGRWLYAAAMLSALTLTGIVALNPDEFEVLFRNVPIVFAALTVAMQARQPGRRRAR